MIRTGPISFQYTAESTTLEFPALEIESGRRVALIGPSGSGKTTLLRLLSGILESPQPIEVDAKRLAELNDVERREFRLRHFGLVFQDFKLLEYLNVTHNILLPFRLDRSLQAECKLAERIARLQHLAGALRLSHKLRAKVGELSHGEQQRVTICRSLITNPSMLLADEPTGSLDPETKELALEQFFLHSGPGKATLIFATHDYSLLERFDEIIDLTIPSPVSSKRAS